MASSGSSHGVKVDMIVMYTECLHNHATNTTSIILDGCGLFEATARNGTAEAKICAACKCHRNFHRRIAVELPPCYNNQTRNNPVQQQQQHASNPAPGPVIGGGLPHPRVHVQTFTSRGPSSGIGREDVNQMQNSDDGDGSKIQRKVMTREQGERLRAIAESNNWKMFKEYSKEEVHHICAEVGIRRTALKSWINNHRRRRAAIDADAVSCMAKLRSSHSPI